MSFEVQTPKPFRSQLMRLRWRQQFQTHYLSTTRTEDITLANSEDNGSVAGDDEYENDRGQGDHPSF